MNFELINEPNKEYSAIMQIMHNRGIDQKDFYKYTHLDDSCIESFVNLDLNGSLLEAARVLLNTIANNEEAFLIVDCDCDGYTSAAVLINYLYHFVPTWTKEKLKWWMHDAKQHGLSDCVDIAKQYKLVICPDSSSNDYTQHEIIKQAGGQVIVLDHHLADKISSNAIIINNQLSNYTNKELSGVGVVWQFCKYLDSKRGTNDADNFLDLVAIGLTGDMMSLKSFETKYLISKGLRKEYIKNPFIEYTIDKNNFPLSKADYVSSDSQMACTPMGAAFFIVPFINAITRSGTIDEKKLIFKAMLEHEALTKVPEIKRGKLTGKQELLVLQAVRVMNNVKNRQTRAEDNGLAMLEKRIKDNNMLDDAVLVFLLEPGQIEAEIRGLIANKFMAKYQRPCAILTRNGDKYEGSMRGYTKNGLDSFKTLLEECRGVSYVAGHDNAAGLGIFSNELSNFKEDLNNKMKDYQGDPLYRVDYAFDASEDNNEKILDIARMNDYWGQDFDRAKVLIKFKVTQDNFAVMKSNTLKVSLPHDLSLIKFSGTDDDIDNFTTDGWKEFYAICKCNVNSWNGYEYPQLIIEDYELIDSCKYFF